MKVFLDTNVWIDFLLARQPHYLAAVTLLTLAERGEVELTLSSATMLTSNYVCCERANMPQYNWNEKILGTRDLVCVESADAGTIYDAINLDWNDYEDAVQYLVAQKSGCDCIVSRNPKDFARSNLPIVSPDELIAQLKS